MINRKSVVPSKTLKSKSVMKNNLKVHRAVKNLTQAQLAKKIGVSRQTINAIESQNYVPSTKLALRLSQEFDISVNDIFTLVERKPESNMNEQLNNGSENRITGISIS